MHVEVWALSFLFFFFLFGSFKIWYTCNGCYTNDDLILITLLFICVFKSKFLGCAYRLILPNLIADMCE